LELPYVPGNAVEGYCTKCKADTVHIITVVDGIQIRSVRCEKCGTEGRFRSPRDRTKAGLREVAARRKSAKTRKRPRKRQESAAQVFRKLLEGKDLAQAKKYSIKAKLDVGDVVEHPKFGTGVVTSLSDATKATITFEDGPRVMACKKK